MKATVYAAVDSVSPSRWKWRISLDIGTDLRHWLRHGQIKVVAKVEPMLPLGVALDLVRALDGKPVVDVGQVIRSLQQVCGERGVSSPEPDSVRLIEMEAEEMLALAGPATEVPSDSMLALLVQFLRGRALIPEEVVGFLRRQGMERAEEVWPSLVQTAYLNGWVTMESGLQVQRMRKHWQWSGRLVYRCGRCGNSERMCRTECASCGHECIYCEECLNMGRVRACTPLIAGVEPPDPDPAVPSGAPGVGWAGGSEETGLEPALSRWGLSDAQKEAVRQAHAFLRRCREGREGGRREFLIWAVTGAGKTEMLFPLLEQAIAKGEKVLIATPRKDVVKELEPRLGKAFPHAPPIALYGGSEARWESGPVVLATTHQLLRFRHFFDLVVIDELDAFPYHNNPMLQHASVRAGKPGAPRILLSATPPESMRKRALRGRMPHVKVPVRYHRHPLPVPLRLHAPPIAKWLQRGIVPPAVRRRLLLSLDRKAQVFLFVPRIALVDPLVVLLRSHFPRCSVEGTYSRDPERHDKVLRFRDRTTHLLVTTTILERGVTVKRSDVYIADADDRMFDAAALIQMAGRAGRSAEDPHGKVWFLSREWTRTQRLALRDIRMMNRSAQRAGYFSTG